jgi:hypothetical protein
LENLSHSRNDYKYSCERLFFAKKYLIVCRNKRQLM